jgi:hypothetical protein
MTDCTQCQRHTLEFQQWFKQHDRVVMRLNEAERANQRLVELNTALIDTLTTAIASMRTLTKRTTTVVNALDDVVRRWPIDHATRIECETMITEFRQITNQ